MWNSGATLEQGGGYMNNQGGGKFDSPSQAGGRGGKTKMQNIVALSVADFLEAMEGYDENIKIGGRDVHMVTLVGLIRSVNQAATHTIYELDDLSGPPVEARHWINTSSTGEMDQKPIVENTYVRVSGNPRSMQGKPHIQAFSVVPITDLNEITCHLLEITYHRMSLQKSTNNQMKQNDTNTTSYNNNFGTSSFGDSSAAFGDPGISGLTESQRRVYQGIQACMDQHGCAYNWLFQQLSNMSASVIRREVEFLTSEGHIYSTIDDEHFKTTS